MLIASILLLAAAPGGQDASPPPREAPVLAPAEVTARWPAEEAKQGVVADARHFYAISNNLIGKYDKKTGRRVARWEGDKRLYPHMNSCVIDGTMLVCAASNYPAVPMASAVELFDTRTMQHVKSVALAPFPGSLTWIERKGDRWWAMFANYPADHGGEGGRDHRWTVLMELDAQFQPLRSWHFPPELLARFAPMSSSGGSWGKDGLLYVTGHDRPELYAVKLPEAGTLLEWVATVPIPTNGQAVTWDPVQPRTLWSIERKAREVVASRVPAVR